MGKLTGYALLLELGACKEGLREATKFRGLSMRQAFEHSPRIDYKEWFLGELRMASKPATSERYSILFDAHYRYLSCDDVQARAQIWERYIEPLIVEQMERLTAKERRNAKNHSRKRK